MDKVGALSSTISAMSKLPSRNGLAMSKMPGSVVPGPCGSFAVAGTVEGVGCGNGESDGVRTAVAEGGVLAVTGADRGSSASR
jgi:hypothetical protein